jgi:hypothetical protein
VALESLAQVHRVVAEALVPLEQLPRQMSAATVEMVLHPLSLAHRLLMRAVAAVVVLAQKELEVQVVVATERYI